MLRVSQVKFQDLGLSEDCDAALAELRRQKSRLRIRICQVKSLRNARQAGRAAGRRAGKKTRKRKSNSTKRLFRMSFCDVCRPGGG